MKPEKVELCCLVHPYARHDGIDNNFNRCTLQWCEDHWWDTHRYKKGLALLEDLYDWHNKPCPVCGDSWRDRQFNWNFIYYE